MLRNRILGKMHCIKLPSRVSVLWLNSFAFGQRQSGLFPTPKFSNSNPFTGNFYIAIIYWNFTHLRVGVVMEGDSCTEGCGFKTQHRILDGNFSHIFVVKIVMFV